MKKIIYSLIFLYCCINVTAIDLSFNYTSLPTTYNYNLTFTTTNSTYLNYTTNDSILTTNVSGEFINNISTITIPLTFNISQNTNNKTIVFTIFENYTQAYYHYNFNLFIINNTPQDRKFMQISTTSYLFNLFTYEMDDFKTTINITIYGNGIVYTSCTNWLTCNPYSFNLSNTTIAYPINITTRNVSEGTYQENATFWLISQSNSSIIDPHNISFIFSVRYVLEPYPLLNESCNIANMTFTEFFDCQNRYYRGWEERIKSINNTVNVTQLVNITQYEKVILWNETDTNQTISKLLELNEIDRLIKSERSANKRLETQLNDITQANTELNDKYKNLVDNLPNITRDIVSSMHKRMYEMMLVNDSLKSSLKIWNIVKYILASIIVLGLCLGGYIWYQKAYPWSS